MQIPEPLRPGFDGTLRLKTTRGGSSAFVMNYKGEPWVVTASHIFEGLSDDEDFTLHGQDGTVYHEQDLELVGRRNPDADVSVFRLPTTQADSEPLLEPYEGAIGSHMAQNVRLGQHVRFLGFPQLSKGLKDNYKTPLVRRAIVSGQAQANSNIWVWVLDGMGNHGFSGGPVLIRERKSTWRVLGVVSYYVSEIVHAYSEVDPSLPDVDSASENHCSPCETTNVLLRNAGLAVCFDICHAIADIDQHLNSNGDSV